MKIGDKIKILECPDLIFGVKNITDSEYVLETTGYGLNIPIGSMPEYEEVEDGETD